jgi:hypothetical protein
MISQLEKQIRDDELTLKQTQMDLAELESEGADGYIKSAISGTVRRVENPELIQNGSVLIEVSGGSGYMVDCIVGELSLSQISIGAEMQVFSADSSSVPSARCPPRFMNRRHARRVVLIRFRPVSATQRAGWIGPVPQRIGAGWAG